MRERIRRLLFLFHGHVYISLSHKISQHTKNIQQQIQSNPTRKRIARIETGIHSGWYHVRLREAQQFDSSRRDEKKRERYGDSTLSATTRERLYVLLRRAS